MIEAGDLLTTAVTIASGLVVFLLSVPFEEFDPFRDMRWIVYYLFVRLLLGGVTLVLWSTGVLVLIATALGQRIPLFTTFATVLTYLCLALALGLLISITGFQTLLITPLKFARLLQQRLVSIELEFRARFLPPAGSTDGDFAGHG